MPCHLSDKLDPHNCPRCAGYHNVTTHKLRADGANIGAIQEAIEDVGHPNPGQLSRLTLIIIPINLQQDNSAPNLRILHNKANPIKQVKVSAAPAAKTALTRYRKSDL